MQVKLKVLGGAHEGKEIQIRDDKFFIGRGDSCQLRPKSDAISRKHCVIVQKNNALLVADLKSRNGTFINDQQLEPERAHKLHSGDRLRVGQLEFEVLVEHGIGGAKKPQVASVKEAVARMAEEASASNEPKSDSFDVASWLLEADTVDRTTRRPLYLEPETKMLTSEETVNIDLEEAQHSDNSESGSKLRADKREPGKLPPQVKAGAKGNSRSAAEETLKKFFGGR